jgi:hypothetical protein
MGTCDKGMTLWFFVGLYPRTKPNSPPGDKTITLSSLFSSSRPTIWVTYQYLSFGSIQAM